MKQCAARLLAVCLAFATASPCAAGQPVFRAISANAAPASQPRVPGQLYRLPDNAGQIRAVNGTKDQVLVTSRVVRLAPAPPPTAAPVATAGVSVVDGDPQMAQRLAQDLLARQPTTLASASRDARRPVRLILPQDPASVVAPPIAPSPTPVRGNKTLSRLDAYREHIAAAARQHGVDEALVRAVIHAESAGRANAVSRVGAGGLMQLMPATAARFGVQDRFNAAQNIDGGVRYLAWLLRRYNGDVRLATAAYNAGEGAVDRYGGVPPYRETRGYVVKVASLFQNYSLASTGDFSGFFRTASVASSPRVPGPSYARGVRIISSR